MTNHYIFAIASGFVTYDAYLTRECGTNGVTNINLHVDTLVLASPACTKIRGYQTISGRHTEVLQRNAEGIGQCCFVMCTL